MPTKAQLIANRRNARKSTGPKSLAGKATACKNSLKHGFSARQAVISSEDKAEFDLFRRQFLEELAPETPMELMLSERIVILSWRLNRATRIQAQTIDALNKPITPGPLSELEKLFTPKHRQVPPQPPEESPADLALGRLAIKDFSNQRVLDRLLMYERRIENSLYKTITELQRITLIRNLNSG